MANWHAYRCTFRGTGHFLVGDRMLEYGDVAVFSNEEVAKKVKTSDISGGYLEYLGEVDKDYGYLSQNIQDYQDGKINDFKRNYLPVVTFTISVPDTGFDVANKMPISMIQPSRRLMLDKVVAKVGALPLGASGGAINLDNRVHMLLTKGDPTATATQITTYGYTDDNGTLETLGLPLTGTVLDSFQAAQDTIYLGSTSKFAGVFVEMFGPGTPTVPADPNSTAGRISAVRYWNGATWTAFTNVADLTARAGVPLADNGWIAWFEKPANWSNESPVASAHTIVNSGTALTAGVYWVALQYTGNFDANTEVNRIWVPADEPIAEMEFIAVEGGASATPDTFNSIVKQDQSATPVMTENYLTYSVPAWPGGEQPSAADDAIYFGYDSVFGGLLVDVGTVNDVATTPVVSYWNGAEWVATTVVDGTNSVADTLKVDGAITWNLPTDWKAQVATSAMMDSQTLPTTTPTAALYWIRLTWANDLTAAFSITAVRPLRSAAKPITFNVPSNCELAPSDYLNVYVGEVEVETDTLTGVVLELVGADI